MYEKSQNKKLLALQVTSTTNQISRQKNVSTMLTLSRPPFHSHIARVFVYRGQLFIFDPLTPPVTPVLCIVSLSRIFS